MKPRICIFMYWENGIWVLGMTYTKIGKTAYIFGYFRVK
jgi:hypothetical protein